MPPNEPPKHRAAACDHQFEEVDGRMLYRRNGVGPAFEVTAQERHHMKMLYDKRLGHLWMAYMLCVLLLPVGALQRPAFHGLAWPTVFTMILAVAFLMVVPGWPIKNAETCLKGRAPLAAALSKEEARDRKLSRLTWRDVVGASPLVLAQILLLYEWQAGALEKRNPWLMVFGLLVTLTVLIEAARKLRHDRGRRRRRVVNPPLDYP